MDLPGIFNPGQLDIIGFCAKECYFQQSGERSVAWMLTAWQYASRQASPPNGYDVLALGLMVEPIKNRDGFREVGVRVGHSVKPAWQLVPDLVERHLTMVGQATPEEWFREYEEIHPFRDGNGRTGQILYNWLRGSLGMPVFAPNFWDDPRHESPSSSSVLGVGGLGSE